MMRSPICAWPPDWWRTGDQSEITRMGSPLTFWKLQQVPVLWLLDHTGRRAWIDDPIGHQRQLLPMVRVASLWIWLIALALTTAWSRAAYGPRAMALAAWLFALSPNLIAHGSLATMELPLAAATTAMFWFFWRFLSSRNRPWFWASAAAGGLAFSCKYTAIRLSAPIVSRLVARAVARRRERCKPPDPPGRVENARLRADHDRDQPRCHRLRANPAQCGIGSSPDSRTMAGDDDGAQGLSPVRDPAPARLGRFCDSDEPPGEWGCQLSSRATATSGWWYYYFVALAVKVPPGFWLLVVARLALVRPLLRAAGTGRAFLRVARDAPHGTDSTHDLPVLDDHRGRLVAELWGPLLAPGRPAGNRLGLWTGGYQEPHLAGGRGVARCFQLSGGDRRQPSLRTHVF